MENNEVKNLTPIRKDKTGNIVQIAREPRKYSKTVLAIRSVCFWIMLITVVVLLTIAVTAIWIEAGETVAKSISTALVVLAGTGFVALIAPILDKTEE